LFVKKVRSCSLQYLIFQRLLDLNYSPLSALNEANLTGVKFNVTGLIKWEFEYTLFAFQDELVDRLLSIKDKIFLKH
jgi:hypothetical protein